ncbi:MAG: hypothetical protein AB7K36_26095 [Chloroflexota bacterium]
MSGDEAPLPDPLHERAQVRIFTLADYVAVEPSGRLYISGGGLEWVGLPVSSDGSLSFDMAIRLAFPKAIARKSYLVEVNAITGEGKPAGPTPLMQTKMRFDLKLLPENASEISGNLPIRISNYPVKVQDTDVIFLSLSIDGILISRLPVQLRPGDD